MLRIFVFVQMKAADESFAQMTAATLSKDGVFGKQLIAWLEAALWLTCSVDAHITSLYTAYRAIFVVEDLTGGKAWEHHHLKGFGLFSKPTHHIAQRDDVVSLIVHTGRNDRTRQFGGASGAA